MGPRPAFANHAYPTINDLVKKGEELFFDETFEGNGRTCGTCHPAENNLTIDPAFIATLPDNDPLFVAEFIPELAVNFEKPELMRELGLILENTNGFGDLANNFTMRGVPHTLALTNSLEPPPANPALPGFRLDGTPEGNPIQRTGWSGDGAPGNGTLREFALGAVRQHFPKTLNRCAAGESCGPADFRLPNDYELDAMEAFQLSLGRQEELDLAAMDFTSEIVSLGRDLFLSNESGKCNACHGNGGANVIITSPPFPPILVGEFNFNFNTGVEDLPSQPADLIDPSNPGDDGLGNPGDGTFNTPPVVEAADTGPFFHNNSVLTIEGAVAFYNSDAFNNSPAAAGLGPITGTPGILLETTEVEAIAAFLRAINALENIRSAMETIETTVGVYKFSRVRERIETAKEEAADAFQVLNGGGLHQNAQASLKRARGLLRRASSTYYGYYRRLLIKRARNHLERARLDILEE